MRAGMDLPAIGKLFTTSFSYAKSSDVAVLPEGWVGNDFKRNSSATEGPAVIPRW